MSEPAYTRLQVDDRRRQLLELGAELFARHAYDELSMAAIAREAGISKALLYHYFPSKSDYFQATVAAAAEELGAAAPSPTRTYPRSEALTASLDAFLGWIEENEMAYRKLMEGATGAAEVRDLVAGVREDTAPAAAGGPSRRRAAPAGAHRRARLAAATWTRACLDWLEHRDMDREELRNLLLGSLVGALMAAGWRAASRLAGRVPSTQRPSPPSTSFFQIGASAFTRSMISRAPGERLAAVGRGGGHRHAGLRQRHVAHAVLDGRGAQAVALDRLARRSPRCCGRRHLGVGLVLEPLHLAGHALEGDHRAGARVAHAGGRAASSESGSPVTAACTLPSPPLTGGISASSSPASSTWWPGAYSRFTAITSGSPSARSPRRSRASPTCAPVGQVEHDLVRRRRARAASRTGGP